MADNTSTIAGLFMTPEMYQQERQQQFANRAAQLSQLDPGALSNFYAMTGGFGAGNALSGALGAQDPMLAQLSQQRQMLSNVDFTDAKSLAEAAKQATAANRPDIAQQLAQQAINIQARIDEKQAARAQQQAQFEAALAQRKDLAEQANQTRLLIAQMTKAMAGANSDLQRQILQEKLDALKDKAKGIEEARVTKLQNSVDVADNVIQEAEAAKKLVGGLTTGLTGTLIGLKPGSDAYNLQAKIDTIKSQLGFSQLQAMRDASPTGGALGQVSNQEIKFLQAALANLDKGQDATTLKNNLDKVIKHYNNWREAAVGKLNEKGVSTSSNNDPLGLRKP